MKRIAITAAIVALLAVAASTFYILSDAGGVQTGEPDSLATLLKSPRKDTPRRSWPSVYLFSEGETLNFDLSIKSEVCWKNGEEGGPGKRPVAATLEFDGILSLKFFPSGEGYRGAGALKAGRFLINGGAPPWTGELERLFTFTLDKKGYVTGLNVPASESAALMVRRALSSVFPVFPRENVKEWVVRQQDGDGTCRARYELGDEGAKNLRMAKTRLEYLEGAVQGAPSPVVVKSAWTFEMEVSATSGRLVKAEGEDVLGLSMEGMPESETRTFTSVRRSASPGPELPGDYAEAEKRAVKRPVKEAPRASRNPWAKMDAKAVLGSFAKGWSSNSREMDQNLLAWLAADPENILRAIRLLGELEREKGQTREKEYLGVWRLIAELGTPEAQKALIDAAANRALSMQTRMEALGHLSQVANPEPLLADGLVTLYRSIPGDVQGGEAVLRSMTVLALGALGNAAPAENPEKKRISLLLGDILQTAQTPDAIDVLEAVGNAGDPNLSGQAAKWFDSERPELRAEAYRAFRKIGGPEVQASLVARVAAENDERVRVEGIGTIALMPPEKETFAWARARLGDDAVGVAEKTALVEYLGKNVSVPENRDALKKAGALASSRALKIKIYNYVEP